MALLSSPLPYRHFVIRTSINADKAAAIVSSALGPRRSTRSVFSWFPDGDGFEGTVDDDGFKIKRKHSYWRRRSVLSVAYGRFDDLSHRVDIDVRITVSPLSFAVLAIFVVAGISQIVSYLNRWATTKSLDSGLGFTLLVMLLLYALITLSFNHEADLAEDFINDMFKRYRIHSG